MSATVTGPKKKLGLAPRGENSVSESPPAAVLEVSPPRQATQLDMLPSAAIAAGRPTTEPTCIGDAIAKIVDGPHEVEQPAGAPDSAQPNVEQPTGHVVNLRLSSLLPGKNGRGELDVADLKESFLHSPQLQNIVVRPVDGSDEKYEIIGGHRRVEALRQLGRTHVEARVFETDDVTAELYGIEENLRRKALADEGSALARAKELYEAKGATGRGGDRRSSKFISNGHGGREAMSATAKVAKLVEKSVCKFITLTACSPTY